MLRTSCRACRNIPLHCLGNVRQRYFDKLRTTRSLAFQSHFKNQNPRHKQAGRIATLGLVSSTIVCISESQKAESCAAHLGAQLVTHPDNVLGL
jgi:hypothetical protein